MILSMTGFGSDEMKVSAFGKISVELRSTNHKFLEIAPHLPEGFLSLEDRIKKEIESKVKRGRVTLVINIAGAKGANALINESLLRHYIKILQEIKGRFKIHDEISINTLINLPGILSLEDKGAPVALVWPHLKLSLSRALDELVKTRQKEGKALFGFLKIRADAVNSDIKFIKARFRKALKARLAQLKTDEECSGFIKDADISEEVERLAFHIRNFQNKLGKAGPIGKELDFIAQEMQREANTMGAKSFDTAISGRVVQIKSQIEKMREQVQNVE